MAKKFITVEAGDRVTKVCVAFGTEKKRKIKQAFAFVTPEFEGEDGDQVSSVQDGIIVNQEAFSNALTRNLMANNCADAREVYFTISSSKIPTREVQMPLMSDIKIEAIVESNKKDYFPKELDQHNVLFRVMSRTKKGAEKGCAVLVIAMPFAASDACEAVAEKLNMKLLGVDAVCSSMVDGAALLKQTSVTAFINVQATSTDIAFMRGSELLLQRTLALGGDELVIEYKEATEAGIDYLEAIDDLSNVYAEQNIREGQLTEEDVADCLDRTVSSISRTMDYFSNQKGLPVEQMVLMGTCGSLIGMQEMLEQSTGLPSVQMEHLPAAMPMRNFSSTASYFISTMQAGASGINFGKSDADKKKKMDKAMQGNTEVSPTMAGLIFFLLAVGAGYWAYISIAALSDAEAELSSLKAQVEQLKPLDQLFVEYEQFEASKNTLLDFAVMTENPNENLLEFLAELEAKMPEEILILNASCGETAISMSVTVTNLVEAATVLAKLRTFDSIEVFSTSDIALTKDEAGNDTASFSLVCNYGDNPYTSNKNPYRWDIGIGDDEWTAAPPPVPETEDATTTG